jgi:hypothetical protein
MVLEESRETQHECFSMAAVFRHDHLPRQHTAANRPPEEIHI